MKRLVLGLIRFYQKTAIFHTVFARQLFLSDRVCRFYPTCSEYTYQAINKYGIMKGMWIGIKRIVRCHPGNPGGIDNLK